MLILFISGDVVMSWHGDVFTNTLHILDTAREHTGSCSGDT